jgi:predicted RNA polymerase sigma factor
MVQGLLALMLLHDSRSDARFAGRRSGAGRSVDMADKDIDCMAIEAFKSPHNDPNGGQPDE